MKLFDFQTSLDVTATFHTFRIDTAFHFDTSQYDTKDRTSHIT
jgi:hypothetical protein